jgi:hypothetical protein
VRREWGERRNIYTCAGNKDLKRIKCLRGLMLMRNYVGKWIWEFGYKELNER